MIIPGEHQPAGQTVNGSVTDEQIADLSRRLIEEAGERVPKSGFWSGCNYWVNQGKSEVEPIGTAMSMHDCDACEKVGFCKAKRTAPIWRYNAETEEMLNQAMRDNQN